MNTTSFGWTPEGEVINVIRKERNTVLSLGNVHHRCRGPEKNARGRGMVPCSGAAVNLRVVFGLTT